jgi:hypothetical protein
MNTRTNKAPVGNASARTSHVETDVAQYINPQPARKGPSDVTNWQALRNGCGCANLETVCRIAGSEGGVESGPERPAKSRWHSFRPPRAGAFVPRETLDDLHAPPASIGKELGRVPLT